MRDREAAKKRAHNLVAQMSVEEKAEQLKYGASAIGRLGVPSYNWWNEALHGVARAGTATMFPQAIGMAATFDTGLLKQLADAMHVSCSLIGHIERGSRKPSLETLVSLCKVLNIPVDVLLS